MRVSMFITNQTRPFSLIQKIPMKAMVMNLALSSKSLLKLLWEYLIWNHLPKKLPNLPVRAMNQYLNWPKCVQSGIKLIQSAVCLASQIHFICEINFTKNFSMIGFFSWNRFLDWRISRKKIGYGFFPNQFHEFFIIILGYLLSKDGVGNITA